MTYVEDNNSRLFSVFPLRVPPGARNGQNGFLVTNRVILKCTVVSRTRRRPTRF